MNKFDLMKFVINCDDREKIVEKVKQFSKEYVIEDTNKNMQYSNSFGQYGSSVGTEVKKKRLLAPYHMIEYEYTNDCPTDYLDPEKVINNNDDDIKYCIRSLQNILGVSDSKLTSKYLVGLNVILQAIEDGTHKEYLKEVSRRLCIVLEYTNSKCYGKSLDITTFMNNVLRFLLDNCTNARLASYLWRSSLPLTLQKSLKYVEWHGDDFTADLLKFRYIGDKKKSDKIFGIDYISEYLYSLVDLYNVDTQLIREILNHIKDLDYTSSKSVTDFLKVNKDKIIYTQTLSKAKKSLSRCWDLEDNPKSRINSIISDVERGAALVGFVDFRYKIMENRDDTIHELGDIFNKALDIE